MNSSMKEKFNSDPSRWDSWVTFAWVIAALSIVSAVIAIIVFGTTSLPSGVGNTVIREQVIFFNTLVWVASIVEVIFAVMAAAAFSILNSIYKNSCGARYFPEHTYPSEKAEKRKNINSENDVTLNSDHGVQITFIGKSSPLYRRISEGYSILKVNGVPVSSEQGIDVALRKGKNHMEVRSPGGKISQFVLKTNLDSLLVNIE